MTMDSVMICIHPCLPSWFISICRTCFNALLRHSNHIHVSYTRQEQFHAGRCVIMEYVMPQGNNACIHTLYPILQLTICVHRLAVGCNVGALRYYDVAYIILYVCLRYFLRNCYHCAVLYLNACVCMNRHVCTRVYVCMPVLNINVCAHSGIYVCKHVCMHECIYACMCACMPVCMYVIMYVCM